MKNQSKSPIPEDQQAWLDATPLGDARSIERCVVTFTVDRRAPGDAGAPLHERHAGLQMSQDQSNERFHLPKKILGQLNSSGRVEIHLYKNHSAWDPTTGKVSILGPARVTYTKTKDGIQCKVDRSVSS